LDDFFFVLMIIFFIVAPILEKVTKGSRSKQQQQPPPRRRTRPAERQRLPDGRTTTVSQPTETAGQTARDASDLLPAELWEILTGKQPDRRNEPTTAQAKPPAPAPARPPAERPEIQLGDRRQRDRSPRDRRPHRDRRPFAVTPSGGAEDKAATELLRHRESERLRRNQIERSSSRAAALDAGTAAGEARHAAFHEKLERLAAAPVVAKRKARISLDLDDRPSLQRAILLQEVLGTPRGLQD
jgi:hypothetical protein